MGDRIQIISTENEGRMAMKSFQERAGDSGPRK